MSISLKDLKTEFGTVAECLQASESMLFLKCQEVRDETAAIMQVGLSGEFHNVVCRRDDLCDLQDATKSLQNQPEKQELYQEELYIAQKDLMGHEKFRRG